MKSLRNSVSLIGRLGVDPEIISLDNGNKVAKFTLATSDYYKNKNGEKVDDTQWHRIVAYGAQADIIEKYLKKGKEICLEGKLNYKNWETKSGEKRFSTEIVLNDFLFIGKKEN
jgi:single-strand DNA-binding protein